VTAYSDRVRALALSLPATYEDSPWGFPVFNVADNKLFAMMTHRDDKCECELTVKVTPEERDIALRKVAIDHLMAKWGHRLPADARPLARKAGAEVDTKVKPVLMQIPRRNQNIVKPAGGLNGKPSNTSERETRPRRVS